jgi:catechol 2,3-dioxygenase-like lactoylglutathione lyase family enzyme
VLPCTDFGRCVAFYRDTLGFKVEESTDMPGNATVYGGRGSVFNLYERPEPTRAEHTAAGILVDDFDEAIRHLRARGVRLEDIDQPGLKTQDGIATIGEFRGSWFKDSEGNIIAVMPAAAMAGMRRAA